MAQLITYENFVLDAIRLRLAEKGHPPWLIETVLARCDVPEEPDRKEWSN